MFADVTPFLVRENKMETQLKRENNLRENKMETRLKRENILRESRKDVTKVTAAPSLRDLNSRLDDTVSLQMRTFRSICERN